MCREYPSRVSLLSALVLEELRTPLDSSSQVNYTLRRCCWLGAPLRGRQEEGFLQRQQSDKTLHRQMTLAHVCMCFLQNNIQAV